MRSVLALAGKDLRLLLRDRVGFFFILFFPLLYAVFFGAIFSTGGGGMRAMGIAVVDEDGTGASRRFVERLEDSSEFAVTRMGRKEAVDSVRRGKQLAYVALPAGFEASREAIFLGKGIPLEVGLDPARKAEAGMLRGILTRYAFQEMQEAMSDRAAMRRQVQSGLDGVLSDEGMPQATKGILERFLGELDTFLVELPEETPEGEPGEGEASPGGGMPAWNPIDIRFASVVRERTGPRTAYDITMPQAFIWMFIGTAAAFAVSLVTERRRGTLMRLRTAPVGLAQILAGKALACFATLIAGFLLLFAFFFVVFGVRPDSYALLALAFLCSAVAFVGIMMLISVLGKTEASVGGASWALLLLMAMLGGGMLPLAIMPGWMRTLSNISFVKWAVLAAEGAVWRGFSLQEMLLPCGILLAIGVVGFALGVRIFRATAD